MATKKYVKIHSDVTINVTAGLHNEDVTNKDAHVPDRLKVNPLWPKLTVMIKQGSGWYPSEIATWETVKALARDKVLTIGEYSDECSDKVVESVKETLKTEIDEVKTKLKKGATLENISAEV